MKQLKVGRLCLAVLPILVAVGVFAVAASADVGSVSFSSVTSGGFTVNAVESDVAGCGPESLGKGCQRHDAGRLSAAASLCL